jgi:hypothetical protein
VNMYRFVCLIFIYVGDVCMCVYLCVSAHVFMTSACIQVCMFHVILMCVCVGGACTCVYKCTHIYVFVFVCVYTCRGFQLTVGFVLNHLPSTFFFFK